MRAPSLPSSSLVASFSLVHVSTKKRTVRFSSAVPQLVSISHRDHADYCSQPSGDRRGTMTTRDEVKSFPESAATHGRHEEPRALPSRKLYATTRDRHGVESREREMREEERGEGDGSPFWLVAHFPSLFLSLTFFLLVLKKNRVLFIAVVFLVGGYHGCRCRGRGVCPAPHRRSSNVC